MVSVYVWMYLETAAPASYGTVTRQCADQNLAGFKISIFRLPFKSQKPYEIK